MDIRPVLETVSLLIKNQDKSDLIEHLVHQAMEVTQSDLSCYYHFSQQPETFMTLSARRGNFNVLKNIGPKNEFICFLNDCNDYIVLSERNSSFLADLLLSTDMNSGIVFPVTSTRTKEKSGFIFLNSMNTNFYNKKKINQLNLLVHLISLSL